MSIEFVRLKELLLEQVGRQLVQYGFSRRPRFQEFSKKTAFGRLGFHLSFIKHREDFDVKADVAIRFDEVEELVNTAKASLSSAERRNTYSLGADLENITGEGDKRWIITRLADVEPAAESIADSFRSVGIPYFEEYSDVERVLQTLSSDAERDWVHSPIRGERAMRAIALAFVLGDRKRFSAISGAKTRLLTAHNDHQLRLFIKLRDQLKDRLTRQKAPQK